MSKRYGKAEKEFMRLAGVDADPTRMTTISDLVFIAQFEVDLFEEGDSELEAKDVTKIRKFIEKWS